MLDQIANHGHVRIERGFIMLAVSEGLFDVARFSGQSLLPLLIVRHDQLNEETQIDGFKGYPGS